MKERPILFSGPMVRALLAGAKRQTRRIVKLPHQNPLGKWEVFPWGGPNGGRTRDGQMVPFQNVISHSRTGEIIGSPYGQPGDRLWVREAWRTDKSLDAGSGSFIADACVEAGYKSPWAPLQYESDGARRDWAATFGTEPTEAGRYRHGRYMPRWASRITLEVTGVRVERLQDISEEDARAEGARECDPVSGREVLLAGSSQRGSHILHYRDIWEQINGPGSWAANPFVWVVEFKVVAS